LAACLQSAGIGPGDEVILSSYTCLAVPTAVIAAGATPTYMDIDPETLNVDAGALSAALSPRVRAIVVQHTLGKVAPIDAILTQARQRGLLVIEDCALAVGSSINGRPVGTFGDAAVFSMELSKTVSCGWGGILFVRNRALAQRMEALYATLPEPRAAQSARDAWQTAISAWCHQPSLYDLIGKYVLHLFFKIGLFRRSTPAAEFDGRIGQGFMLRMSGAAARLAALQWRDFERIAKACEGHARRLRSLLEELRVSSPGAPAPGEISITPRVSFLVRHRSEIHAYFLAQGIELGEWFDGPMSPVPSSPLFNYHRGSYPNAEQVARHVVNLPCHSRISDSDLAHIETVLREFASRQPASLQPL
jgi:perosamine synthetase